MTKASLVLLGSGIKFFSHLTNEASVYIKESDKVLYLVNDPAMKEWIHCNNPQSESLDEIYKKYHYRSEAYAAITEHILITLYTGCHLCVIMYGHPTVFAKPGLDAVLKARQLGFDARILPGISAEACLFADLFIDPGEYGCQSFETTDFLIRKRKFDPNSHLILWQADVIGRLDNPETHDNSVGIQFLIEYLHQYYSSNHEIIIYEAAQYPGFQPRIEYTFLDKLCKNYLSKISMLYIPPRSKTLNDQLILSRLNIQ